MSAEEIQKQVQQEVRADCDAQEIVAAYETAKAEVAELRARKERIDEDLEYWNGELDESKAAAEEAGLL